jgi:SAM-dependent methyltransferase
MSLPLSTARQQAVTATILDAPAIVQTESYEHIDQIQIDVIRTHSRQLGRPLSILEAGCGQRWTFDLSGTEYTLTGVDLDPVALELRKTKTRDLDVAIVGDIASIELPVESFDVVYSSFVLEHVQRADVAVKNFARWLKPGGLLILRLPEPSTAYGFLASKLPHGAHVFFYRHILGVKTAGQPGYAPYPTYYHPVIGRERLCRFLGEPGVRCVGTFGDGFRSYGKGLKARMMNLLEILTSMLSFGALTADYSNLLYVAVKESPSIPQL